VAAIDHLTHSARVTLPRASEIRSGLEGVVAFATEIAEPDRPTAKCVGPGPRPLPGA